MTNANLFRLFLHQNSRMLQILRSSFPPLLSLRELSSSSNIISNNIKVLNKEYPRDSWTNLPPKILSVLEECHESNGPLHLRTHHPLQLLRSRITNFFYKEFENNRGNPLFSVHDQLSPVVSLAQNFDSLLIPQNHPSRSQSDSYYLNSQHLLRAHTSAHLQDLISMGLDNFLVFGDVYRRDEIDSTHYPIFHQAEIVRLSNEIDSPFDDGKETPEKQNCHTLQASQLLELEMKNTLIALTKQLFGSDIQFKWVDAYFPFTHPSWELEILYCDKWIEVLGCGIVRQEILFNSGVPERIGWACGLGLERLAMKLYQIPDIRLFWSKDPGFLNQFVTDDVNKSIIYKEISKFPQCINDISFWLHSQEFSSNDFYDLVRECAGDVVEQVQLIDTFYHPKKKMNSHCYRITYRHMEKTLTQEEVNRIHSFIEQKSVDKFGVEIR
uniref:Phenylalanine--tRNA ligase, mitochondrial n=1 Tax=Lepeophtheirus salmonis TaxID=72036 RepID=A0A0K2TTW7_LEPSM